MMVQRVLVLDLFFERPSGPERNWFRHGENVTEKTRTLNAGGKETAVL